MLSYRLKVARLFASVVSNRLMGKKPFFLSHLVTSRCNCGCPVCIWRDQAGEELDTGEIEKLYSAARETGFTANVIWGGEPLLRQDLPVLCRTSRRLGMGTALITNGYFLPERYRELAPEIDVLIVSLDYAHASGHDAYRRCPGLFDRAVEGIRHFRADYPRVKVFLNCLLHGDNQQEVRDVVSLARELGVSVYLSPAIEGENLETGGSNREDLASDSGYREAAQLFLELKRQGFHVNNSYRYLQGYLLENRGYRCRVPFVFLTVLADGTILHCFTPGRPIGSTKEKPFKEIVRGINRRDLVHLTSGCQKCPVPDVVETSYIWALYPEPLYNAFKVLSNL